MSDVTTRRYRPYAARMAPDDRRNQLLDAALTIMNRDGIHRVSIDTVAREAGVARTVVYRQFDDSTQLLKACLEREERAVMEQLDPIRRGAEGMPIVDGIVFYLDQFLTAIEEAPAQWRVVLAMADSSTQSYRRRVEHARAFIVATFERRIERAAGDEIAAEADIEMLARAMWALLWDGGRALLEDPDRFPRSRQVAFAQRTVPAMLNGVSVPT